MSSSSSSSSASSSTASSSSSSAPPSSWASALSKSVSTSSASHPSATTINTCSTSSSSSVSSNGTASVSAAPVASRPCSLTDPSFSSFVDYGTLHPQLSAELDSFVSSRLPSPSITAQRHAVVAALNLLLYDNIDKRAQVTAFGSVATNASTHASDIDCGIAILGSATYGVSTIDYDRTKSLLKRIAQTMNSSNNYFNISALLNTRVPLIKCVDRATGINIDISMCQPMTQYKTALIQRYIAFDTRVLSLLTCVKAWAASHGFNDAQHHSINSFGWTLMVIQFMQMVNILPNLQRRSIDGEQVLKSTIELIHLKNINEVDPQLSHHHSLDNESRCAIIDSSTIAPSCDPLPLVPLLINFFYFYGSLFDPKRDAVVIRSGYIADRGHFTDSYVPTAHRLNRVGNFALIVQDPFDLNESVTRSVESRRFEAIQNMMQRTESMLKRGSMWRDTLGRLN